MAKIELVADKPEGLTDRHYGTGVTWAGKGDVQEVEDIAAATKMLEHSDTWKLADGEKLPVGDEAADLSDDAVKAKKLAEAQRKQLEEDQEERETALFGVLKMGKTALIAHAKRNFGLDLDPKKSVETMRTEIQRLTNRSAGKPDAPKSAAKASKPAAKSAKKR